MIVYFEFFFPSGSSSDSALYSFVHDQRSTAEGEGAEGMFELFGNR